MTDTEQLQTDTAGSDTVPPATRALLRLVYIMGIVLVLLLFVLVGGIIWKATQRSGPKPAEGPARFSLGLAEGDNVTQVVIDGDRMAVTTSRAIFIVDLRKQQVVSQIDFKSQ
ncbi:MAG: hypothetical protein KDK89_21310 [Alphaproteobacteria bacterium]|nr:hypothetical protein [Alphaproteobacteria bacterium]